MRNKVRITESGFSLIELMVVVAMAMVMAGLALYQTMSVSENGKATTAMNELVSQLRTARSLAISKRRNVQVDFTAPNKIQLTVLTLPGEALPAPMPPVYLNDNIADSMQFFVFQQLPDTPMGFGNATAINLQQPGAGGAWTVMFTTSGALVGTTAVAGLFAVADNNPVNASLFLGIPNKTNTARAVTVFGATGRVRSYYWTGQNWQE
jgi:type II secretory pathway pseudopilin PulG